MQTRRVFIGGRPSRIILSALALVAIIAQAEPAIAGGYSAIAYSKSTGRCGDGYGYNSRAAAERRALRECAAHDAFIAGWGHNRYIALATGPGGAWGFGISNTRLDAERRAIRNCPGPNAHIARFAYSFD